MARSLKLEQVLKEEDIILPGDLSAVISLLFPEHSEQVKGFRLCNRGRRLPTHLLGEMHHSSILQRALLYK